MVAIGWCKNGLVGNHGQTFWVLFFLFPLNDHFKTFDELGVKKQNLPV
jgi:hypothetical protein